MRSTWFRLTLTAAVLSLFLAHLVAPAPITAATAWRYTALGDSLAVGLTAWIGYVPRYRSYTRSDTGASVTLYNRGQSGWTSAELLNSLRSNTTRRGEIAASDIVTWNIGGNDVKNARSSYRARNCGGADNQDCIRTTVADFKRNWSDILAELVTLRSTRSTIMRTMDIYNPYVASDRATDTWPGDAGSDFDVFKPYIDDVNAHIAATATTHGIPVAKVYLKFNGPAGTEDPKAKGYISWDGLHPNDTGHRVIADLLRGLRYAPLQ